MHRETDFPEEVTLGDPASPVGLVTLWTPQERILAGVAKHMYAASGNLYSLWGIGLLVKSMLARPTLRYLVVCGVDRADTGRALVALAAEGLSPAGTLPGTDSRLDGELDAASVERFRRQVTVVDLRGCTEPARIAAAIEALPREPPAERPRWLVPAGWTPAPLEPAAGATGPPLAGAAARAASDPPAHGAEASAVSPMAAAPGPWAPDPLGNFLIAVGGEQLVAAHATTEGGPTGHRFTGRTAAELRRAILAAGLVSRLDHAAYLGTELAFAEVALRLGLPYRQDRRLGLPSQAAPSEREHD